MPLAVVLVLASGLALAAAASTRASSEATPAGVRAARAFVANAMKPPKWNGPKTKVDVSKARGKSVFFVNLTEAIPALHQWSVVLARELKAAGVETQSCDPKGSPNGITSCLQRALASRPDAIVALALDNSFIATYMARAKAAGIPFITAQSGRPSLPKSPAGRVAEVTFDYYRVGRMLGAWFAADSGCRGAPQIITTTSSREPSEAEVAGIQSALKQFCPGIKLRSVQNVLIPDWPTKLPTLTRSLLLADPKLEYLLPLYDGMTLYMTPSVKQLNRSTKVKMAAFNATPVVMQSGVAKNSPVAADVGGPNEWFAVALADQTLRVLAGAKPVANENVPLRLFTRANIRSINLKRPESTWYGSVDPVCEYHKLWGIGC